MNALTARVNALPPVIRILSGSTVVSDQIFMNTINDGAPSAIFTTTSARTQVGGDYWPVVLAANGVTLYNSQVPSGQTKYTLLYVGFSCDTAPYIGGLSSGTSASYATQTTDGDPYSAYDVQPAKMTLVKHDSNGVLTLHGTLTGTKANTSGFNSYWNTSTSGAGSCVGIVPATGTLSVVPADVLGTLPTPPYSLSISLP